MLQLAEAEEQRDEGADGDEDRQHHGARVVRCVRVRGLQQAQEQAVVNVHATRAKVKVRCCSICSSRSLFPIGSNPSGNLSH